MLEIIVLGHIPGTATYITFADFVFILFITSLVYYIYLAKKRVQIARLISSNAKHPLVYYFKAFPEEGDVIRTAFQEDK